MATATPAQAADQVVVPQETLPVIARKLTAPVVVQQHPVIRLAAPQSHWQRMSRKSVSMRLPWTSQLLDARTGQAPPSGTDNPRGFGCK